MEKEHFAGKNSFTRYCLAGHGYRAWLAVMDYNAGVKNVYAEKRMHKAIKFSNGKKTGI